MLDPSWTARCSCVTFHSSRAPLLSSPFPFTPRSYSPSPNSSIPSCRHLDLGARAGVSPPIPPVRESLPATPQSAPPKNMHRSGVERKERVANSPRAGNLAVCLSYCPRIAMPCRAMHMHAPPPNPAKVPCQPANCRFLPTYLPCFTFKQLTD